MNTASHRFAALLALTAWLGAACAPAPAPAPPSAPAAVPAAPAAPAPRAEEPPFYAGKTIRFIVGAAPGGGHDAYIRLLAKHIGKHIPGNPATLVENMPGAGTMIAANHLFKVAKPDGLTVGNFLQGLPLQQLMGAEGVEFDARKFNWVGAMTGGDAAVVVCIVRSDRGIRTAQELLAAPAPVVFGGVGPGSQTDIYPQLLQQAYGANIKLVSGYGGTAPIRLAIERGEVEGGCWSWSSIKVTAKAMLDSGLVVSILQQGVRKHSELAHLPMMTDLARSEEARQLVRLAYLPEALSRPLTAPPGVPEERVKILREAFVAAVKDPELVEEAAKANLELSPVPGDEIVRFIDEMFKTSPEVVKKLAEILK